ncbi:winged helix-turn-helix domain-containing protein [uncultured Slackia sp.]|uniref:winged helix-turn-helix domain-containing protein n=1 Tax=uncultured Slackia sp. TaxID=665903 RepID=UPI0025903CBC|nr:winged helix-turn-helix domain-containing protein [uncultured Slackia sp.]
MRRTHIEITPSEASEVGKALAASESVAARELASAFEEIASERLVALDVTASGTQSEQESLIVVGELSIDTASRLVKLSGAPVQLTPKEFDILAFLALNRGTVFSKEEIYQAVWRGQYLLDDSNIMAFIRKIRKKIEPEPDNPRYVLTVWGVGYKMTEERY